MQKRAQQSCASPCTPMCKFSQGSLGQPSYNPAGTKGPKPDLGEAWEQGPPRFLSKPSSGPSPQAGRPPQSLPSQAQPGFVFPLKITHFHHFLRPLNRNRALAAINGDQQAHSECRLAGFCERKCCFSLRSKSECGPSVSAVF